MNVFYTNDCPIKSAHEHCLVHMNKMIVEYAQLLSCAHHVLDGDNAIAGIYKKTHVNHPSAVWVRKSSEHYEWVWFCAMQLCENYFKLRGKQHATYEKLCILADFPVSISNAKFKQPPVAADDEYKAIAVISGACVAYQKYLTAKFHEWQSRARKVAVDFISTPSWFGWSDHIHDECKV